MSEYYRPSTPPNNRITHICNKVVSLCLINEVLLVIYHSFTQNTAPIFKNLLTLIKFYAKKRL
jgi:hypothetical protein